MSNNFTTAHILLQRLLPQHIVSRIAGKLAECKIKLIKNFLIQNFAKAYQINMQEAVEPNLKKYENFNSFFTRAIKLENRATTKNAAAIISPVDGKISQLGKIHDHTLISAKNSQLSLLQLLTDENLASAFNQGSFITLYLSPRDYHRVHAPLTGTLKKMIYVPGKLFSVNEQTVAKIPNVFTRNERVITIFETAIGKVAVILIGALIVGSMETVWEKNIAKWPQDKKIKIWHYPNEIKLNRGEELGRFKLGSSVIMLLPKNSVNWEGNLVVDQPIKMGEELCTYTLTAKTL